MKKKIIWYYLIKVVLILTYSCKNSNYKADNFVSETNKIDTTLYLKETRGIRDILEDKEGNLWFSSPDYVAKFNGEVMYYFSDDDGLSITGNIQEDKSGIVWVENGFQAFKYNGGFFSQERLDSLVGSDGLWIQRGLNLTDTTYVQPGIYEINRKTTNFHPLPIHKDTYNKFLHLPSTKALISKDSTVWFATMNEIYGFKNNRFTSIGREEMGRQNDERQIGIRGIFVDSKGTLWIADNGAGVFTYDGEEVENFTKKHLLDEGDVEGNSLHRAFSIAEDSEGKMWFGTVYSGIWSYDPIREEFNNYTSDHGVKSDNIWTIYKTNEGELLFAGESPAAVYVFDGKTFHRKY